MANDVFFSYTSISSWEQIETYPGTAGFFTAETYWAKPNMADAQELLLNLSYYFDVTSFIPGADIVFFNAHGSSDYADWTYVGTYPTVQNPTGDWVDSGEVITLIEPDFAGYNWSLDYDVTARTYEHTYEQFDTATLSEGGGGISEVNWNLIPGHPPYTDGNFSLTSTGVNYETTGPGPQVMTFCGIPCSYDTSINSVEEDPVLGYLMDFPYIDGSPGSYVFGGMDFYDALDFPVCSTEFQLAWNDDGRWYPQDADPIHPLKYNGGVNIIKVKFGEGNNRYGMISPSKDGGFIIYETDVNLIPIGMIRVFRHDRTLSDIIPPDLLPLYIPRT